MWLAANWDAVVNMLTTTQHHPLHIRAEARAADHEWAFDQRKTKEQRDYGQALLNQRMLMPSNNEFGAWVKENGLDAPPAQSNVVRSDAMWLAEHWVVLNTFNTTQHHPLHIRAEARAAGHEWAGDGPSECRKLWC